MAKQRTYIKKKKKVLFYNPLTKSNSYSAEQLKVSQGDKKLDIRVEYSMQTKNGSTFQRLPFKLDGFKSAIKEGKYDAQIIILTKDKIPGYFIDYLLEKVKEDRFIYIKVFESMPSKTRLEEFKREMAKKLISIDNQEKSIKDFILNN